MHLPFLKSRLRRSLRRSFVSWSVGCSVLILAAVWYATTARAQFQIQINRFGRLSTAEQDSFTGVYLPSDRALSRAVSRARERLANGEYHEALAFLQSILGRDEDSFLEQFDGGNERLGLKATARRLIGELPHEGLETYELLHGPAARRQLEQALEAGDPRGIAEVVREYFHTAAGYEAALVLAQIEADQGHHLAAAQLYQELIDAPRAADRFEPQLSAMAAVNRLAAGQNQSAAETLRSLFERSPSIQITFSGKTTSAPAASADVHAWLKRYVGVPSHRELGEVHWQTQRGDPKRNMSVPGGPPHLRPRWQARVVNDPTIEAYLEARRDDYSDRGVVVLPAAQPIAVDDVVVMRTPENVVAIDWKTGKRVWETRGDNEFDLDENSELQHRFGGQEQIEQGSPLDERVWDELLANSLSSDGKRVFVLRGMNLSEEEQVMGWPGMGRQLGRGTRAISATTNQIAAYELATEGKLVWELDGARTTGELDGAFFLGAPLAIDNTLYVMAEVRSAIYLVALDPATGAVRWQQQLAGLEQGIAMDPLRRRAGSTPSYDAGILVCPTAAGAVVAIDIVKREFAWVYRYARQPQTPAEARNFWQQAGRPQAPRANDRWLDSTAVIADDHVFLTPPESDELHCVELQTGKLAWKQRQDGSLYLGGVDQDRVILVGDESVRALQVADGAPAWSREKSPLPAGTLPAGHGYISDGHYYLPLTNGHIVAVDIENGQSSTLGPAQPGLSLGNLICYRGSVISQSPLMLDKFEQLEALRERAEAALAENSNDATALRELAELKAADGESDAAARLLKRAFQLAPHDPLTREMLAEMLLHALVADYASFRGDVPLVRELVRGPEQRIKLLRIEARGLAELGQTLPAWDVYTRLADFTTEKPTLLQIDDDHHVRSDRWVAGRLERLWSNASPDERESLTSRLAERRRAALGQHTAAEMRHYLAHLEQLPGADKVRRTLVRFLLDRSRMKEAEVELLHLGNRQQNEHRADAELWSELIGDAADGEFGQQAAGRNWPRGKIEARLIPSAAQPPETRSRNRADRQAAHRLLRIEQKFGPTVSSIQWFVALDCSELVARNAAGDDVFRMSIEQNTSARQYRDSGVAHAARLGHLYYIAVAGQVFAVDARPSGRGFQASLLWKTDPLSRYGVRTVAGRQMNAGTTARTSRRPVYHASSSRKRVIGSIGDGICSLGPVSARGVVFQDQDGLKCVDPLNGDVLWLRSDLPAGCELFGDDELIFAADVNGRVAHVVRKIDGELVGQRDLPRHEWLIAAGRNVTELGFQISSSGRSLSLRVRDIWSEETLFEANYPTGSRMAVAEPDAVAVYEPSGKFQLIDAKTGRLIIERELAPINELHGMETMRCGDQLFLFVSGPPESHYKSVGQFDFPIVNGHVYALDMNTGETLWPGPALVRNRGAVLSPPAGIPLLLFVDRKLTRNAATGGVTQLRVLALDKRTGQTVYRNDVLPDTPLSRFRIRADDHAEPRVALEMSAGKIEWAFTDSPRPPQAPGNDDLEAAREAQERGLRGIGRRIGDVLRGQLENKSGSNTDSENPQAVETERPPVLDDD